MRRVIMTALQWRRYVRRVERDVLPGSSGGALFGFFRVAQSSSAPKGSAKRGSVEM